MHGDRLVATFSQVPPLVRQAVEAGLYRHVSSEIAYQVTFHGERIGKVLVGVALLGADLPAVSNLADLGAYLSARGLTPLRIYRFTRAGTGPEPQGRSMTRHAVTPGPEPHGEHHAPPGARGENPAPDTVARLSAELAQRQADVERLSRREAEAWEALRLSRFHGERKAFAAALESWVRTGALTPDARNKALAAVDAQQSGFGQDAVPAAAAEGAGSPSGDAPEFVFRAGLVRELMETMARPRPFGREAATAAPLGALARQAAQPAADTLSREAGKLAATGRFTLAQAQAHILAQDPDLAARWLAEVNHTLPTGGQ